MKTLVYISFFLFFAHSASSAESVFSNLIIDNALKAKDFGKSSNLPKKSRVPASTEEASDEFKFYSNLYNLEGCSIQKFTNNLLSDVSIEVFTDILIKAKQSKSNSNYFAYKFENLFYVTPLATYLITRN